jgi:hypothetical protein
MATFSARYPRAVHVLPLHALKNISDRQGLIGKTISVSQEPRPRRATTNKVDAALGFYDVVHFYLARQVTGWDSFPILAAQLGPNLSPPFPHVALECGTEPLADDDCVICLWNVAVSRPTVPGVKGGNWARGTSPDRIASVWRAFRKEQPTVEGARGYWNDPFLVPTLKGKQIQERLDLFTRAPRGIPELLLQSPVLVGGNYTLWAFSSADLCVVETLETLPRGLQIRFSPYSNYVSDAPQTAEWRKRIVKYFSDSEPFPIDLDFDRNRSAAVPNQRLRPSAAARSSAHAAWPPRVSRRR